MATWKEPKNDYKKEDQVVPEIFNNLAENERYLQEKKITTEQVQDAEVTSTQSASRESVGDKETVKGFFGKIRKWLADLKALAFKGTVATADIDNSAVTSAKIASNAVTTAKINAKAVTDAKIDTVSASKVTGLHKVATSGSYNDLTDKPSIPSGGGGFNFKKYAFYLGYAPSDIEEGLYLASAIFTNAGSYSNALSFGTIVYNKSLENGSFSNISTVIFDGEEMKVQLHISYYSGKVSISIEQSDNQKGCPYKDFEADGSFYIVLYKLSDLGKVEEESGESGGGSSGSTTKVWQILNVDHVHAYSDTTAKSVEVPVAGLKVGDTIKATAMSIKMNLDYMSESYWYNSLDGNGVYGFTYSQGGWYQHQDYSDFPMTTDELELSSETPFVSRCGLVDYGNDNILTIKISCKRNDYLTIEWSDQAGLYLEMMPLYNFQRLKT